MKNLLKIFVCFAVCLLSACTDDGKDELYMYIWSEYIPEKVIDKFEEETGIKVYVSTYDTSESMFTKIKMTNGEGYDLVMTTIDYMMMLKKQEYLQPFDKTKIPAFANYDERYINPEYDPNNEYSMPFTVGTSSFAVNTKNVDLDKLKSLYDLSRPEFANRLLLLNDMRAVIGMGLKMKGYSVNDTDEDHIREAYDILKTKIIPNVKGYDTEATIQALLNGEVDIAQCWNGIAYQAASENKDIKYVFLKEGGNSWSDGFVLLKGAKNIDAAYKFLNFILRPEISKEIFSEFPYTNPNRLGRELLPPEIAKSPILYPDDEVYRKNEFEGYVGEALMQYDKYWNMLRAN